MLNRTYNNGPPPRIGDLVVSITDVSIHNMRTDESMDNMTVGVVRKTSTAGFDNRTMNLVFWGGPANSSTWEATSELIIASSADSLLTKSP